MNAFFSFKNPTPHDLAIFSAWIGAAVLLTALVFCGLLGLAQWRVVFIMPLGVFVLNYYITTFVLKRFIYRKVKVIYKTIHRLKRSKGEISNKIDLKTHIMDEVEREVVNWAKDQKREIETLKQMEDYRRHFLGNISHELKTPIFNIQGYLYTLLDGGMDDDRIKTKYLNRAISNAERLNTIVQELLSISQLETGQLQLEMERFDIHALTKEVYEDIEIKAKEKNITLRFKEGCNRAFFVYADRERIRQVLTNLVANSIKYGNLKGETRTGFYIMDNTILTEVSDNGIGIELQHIPHLFERFYRADKNRSRDEGGSGLGLAIVKHIIEAHHQTVNVRSRIAIGSTFGFTLERAHT